MRVSSKAAAAEKTRSRSLREQGEYLNPTLVEQPNGDFGHTIVRQVLSMRFSSSFTSA